MKERTRNILWLTILALCIAALAPVGAAAEAPSGWQSLPGSKAGGFDDFTVDYVGGGAELEIEVWFAPVDPSFVQALGFDVYGTGADDDVGVRQDDGRWAFSYSAEDPARLMVQVHNYADVTVSYRAQVSGAAEASVASVAARAMEPELRALVTGMSHTLVGNKGGAFDRYALAYPGDERDTTVRMTFGPLDPSFASAYGFQVYDPHGRRVAEGQEIEPFGVMEATFASDTPGGYVIQVYNYADGAYVNYALSTTS